MSLQGCGGAAGCWLRAGIADVARCATGGADADYDTHTHITKPVRGRRNSEFYDACETADDDWGSSYIVKPVRGRRNSEFYDDSETADGDFESHVIRGVPRGRSASQFYDDCEACDA